MDLLLKGVLRLRVISSNLLDTTQLNSTPMQYFIGSGKVSLRLFSALLHLCDVLAKLFLIDSIVGFLFLPHALPAAYRSVQFNATLLVFA